MPDPISTAASAVSLIDRLAAVWRWLTRGTKQPGYDPLARPPLVFEVQPINFRIDLTRALASIEVDFYAINHLRKTLVLTELKISRFHLSSGQLLEQIPLLQEFQLNGRNSFIVTCRRNLMDSEVRAVAETAGSPLGASLSLVARAARGRRVYQYGPISSLAVDGWITRPVQ